MSKGSKLFGTGFWVLLVIAGATEQASALTCGYDPVTAPNKDKCCGDNVYIGGGQYGRVECKCGWEVLSSYSMTSDLPTCSGDTSALRITRPDVVLNGGGFWIRGSGDFTTKRKPAIDISGTWDHDNNAQTAQVPITGVVIKNIRIDGSSDGDLFPGKWRTCIAVDAAGTVIGDPSATTSPWDAGWQPNVTIRNCGRVEDLDGDGITKDTFPVDEAAKNVDYNGDGDKCDGPTSTCPPGTDPNNAELNKNDGLVPGDEAFGYGIDARAPNITVASIFMEFTGDEGVHFVSNNNPGTPGADNSSVLHSKFSNITHEAIYYLNNGSTVLTPVYGSIVRGNLVTLSVGAYQDSETKAMYLKHAHHVWVEGNRFYYNGVHLIGDSHHHVFQYNQIWYGGRIRLSDYKCVPANKSWECCGYPGDASHPAQPTHCSYRRFPYNNSFNGDFLDGAFDPAAPPRYNHDSSSDMATDYCMEIRDGENTALNNVTLKNCDDRLITASNYYHFNLPQTCTYTPTAQVPCPALPALTTITQDVSMGTFDKNDSDSDHNMLLTPSEVGLSNASFLTVNQSTQNVTRTETLHVVADAYIRGASTCKNKNYGGTLVEWQDVSNNAQFISLLKFQRSALPPGAAIVNESAVLRMVNAQANNYPARVYATNPDANGWVEGHGNTAGSNTGVMWNNYPISNLTAQIATTATGAKNKANDTAITTGFNFDANDYITFAIQGPVTNQPVKFHSREAPGGAPNVRLDYTVTYTPTALWGGTVGCQKPTSGKFTCVATDDSYVRDYTSGPVNAQYNMYGDQPHMKTSNFYAGETRKAIVKFDLSRVTSNPAHVKLRIHKDDDYSGFSQNFAVHRLSDRFADSWTEWGVDADSDGRGDAQDDDDHAQSDADTIACESYASMPYSFAPASGYQNYASCSTGCTVAPCNQSVGPSSEGVTWKNFPATFGSSLGTATRSGSGWWELDVTAEVIQEIGASGNKIISFVLVDATSGSSTSEWESRDGSPDGWPQLVIQ